MESARHDIVVSVVVQISTVDCFILEKGLVLVLCQTAIFWAVIFRLELWNTSEIKRQP